MTREQQTTLALACREDDGTRHSINADAADQLAAMGLLEQGRDAEGRYFIHPTAKGFALNERLAGR